MIRNPRDLPLGGKFETEVCVVGSGAAGGVVAAALAARGRRVVVLEEGPHLEREDFNRREADSFRRLYFDLGMRPALGNVFLPIIQGRCLGGSTTVNQGVALRAPDHVLEEWRDRYGLDGFGPSDLAPHYEAVERVLGVTPVPDGMVNPNNDALRRGLAALGLPGRVFPRNAPTCAGCGVCIFGCPTDAKRSTLVTYLPEAAGHGADVLPSTRAERVIFEGTKAVGVEAALLDPDPDGRGAPRGTLTIRAQAVVVSAGPLSTPMLLERSGLKDRLPHLGRRLRLHPSAMILARFPRAIRGWEGVPMSIYCDAFEERDGYVLEGIFAHPAQISMLLPGLGMDHKHLMADYPRYAGLIVQVHDESEGRVTAGAGGKPLARYSLNPADMERLRKGIRKALEIYFAAGAERAWVPWTVESEVRSPSEFSRFEGRSPGPADLLLYSAHPQGGNVVGLDPADSTADPRFQVHGGTRLYAVDAGSFPTSTAVNPMLTVQALALKAARAVHEDLG